MPGYGRLYGLDVWVNDDDDGAAHDARWAWWATVEGSPQLPNAFSGALEDPQKTQATIAPQDAGMLLSWTHFAWNDAYEVQQHLPYFLPDEWTRLTVVGAHERVRTRHPAPSAILCRAAPSKDSAPSRTAPATSSSFP